MRQKKAICTITLVVVNVAVFFLLTFQGMTEDPVFMMNHGAMYAPFITEGEEYYRLFSSMFLHFGFPHLMNNMMVLGLLGWQLEMEIGKIKYLIIYFVSGFGGNLLSLAFELRGGEYAVSAGASGAIFGLIGALLYIAIRNRGRVGTVSGRGIVFMVVITLYYGFTSTGIDNMAHIGGLLTGIVLGLLLYWKRNSKRRAVTGY